MNFQQVLCIWLFSEDRRPQVFVQPRFASGQPTVGSDVLNTLATSIFPDQELHLGMQICLSHSVSCEKCPSGSVVCHLLPPKALPVILPWHVVPSPSPCSMNVRAATARGTSWAVSALTGGECASLFLIFNAVLKTVHC